jgi:hypothetical protein
VVLVDAVVVMVADVVDAVVVVDLDVVLLGMGHVTCHLLQAINCCIRVKNKCVTVEMVRAHVGGVYKRLSFHSYPSSCPHFRILCK